MKYTVFTYGTLMKGQRNHHYVESSQYICGAILYDYSLFDTPYDYPAAVKAEGHKVYGEVYEVDDRTKEQMDELEEVGILYDCSEVMVETENGKMKAFFYEYLKSTERMKPYIRKGKWVCSKDRKE